MQILELKYPNFDPVALRIFGFSIYWYALMYLAAFALGYGILRLRLKRAQYSHLESTWNKDQVDGIILATIFGVVVGGRLGYVLFYQSGYYFSHPLQIFNLQGGGMSFHGGAIGVIVALIFVAYKYQHKWLEVTDFLLPAVPPGLTLGRFGNFINGELWGRTAPSDLPWAMVFPHAGPQPRHPSQLYELFLEGIVLGIVLLIYACKTRPLGSVSAVFLIGYGTFRCFVELFREPDSQLGLLSLGLSMGQWLSVPMILGGMGLWIWSHMRKNPPQLEDPKQPTDLAEPESKQTTW